MSISNKISALLKYYSLTEGQNKIQQEYSVDSFLKMDIRNPWIVDKIAETITAENICEMPKEKDVDHIEQIFKVNKKLKQLAKTTTENTEFLQNLADKVEDLAVELLDQVHTKEEANIKDKEGDADRYGSLFSEMTKKAIIYGQKKFVSHPFLFKRVKMRWQRGSPFKSAGILHFFSRLLFIVLGTILTPLLLPLIAYTFYRDQKRTQNRSHKNKKPELVAGGSDQTKRPLHMTQQDIDQTKDHVGLKHLKGDQTRNQLEMTSQDREQKEENSEMTQEDGERDKEQGEMSSEEKDRSRDFFEWYFDYTNTPLVIFVKTEFMKLVFIALHCRICVLGSSVLPSIEESLVFVFFLAVMLSEYEQWRTSAPEFRSKVYFKDIWNWVDLLTMVIYVIIVILRAIIIVRGRDPFHNRLLEIVSYCYGFNTMFLFLRFSSILE